MIFDVNGIPLVWLKLFLSLVTFPYCVCNTYLLQVDYRGFVCSLFVEQLDYLVCSCLDGKICESESACYIIKFL